MNGQSSNLCKFTNRIIPLRLSYLAGTMRIAHIVSFG